MYNTSVHYCQMELRIFIYYNLPILPSVAPSDPWTAEFSDQKHQT